MNKEEKIGMYTRDEIFEHLCKNSNIGMLGRSMYDAVMSKIDNLQSKLDNANKKLDKIKAKINDYSCIYNKGFPYNLLIAVRGMCFNENQYLELDKVLEDFNSIIGGE